MPSKDAQTRQVLRHMELFGSITSAEAIRHYGCTRLAARISDLRRQGIPIKAEMVYQDGRRWAVYAVDT